MDKLDTIVFSKRTYVQADDLRKEFPCAFKGCKSIRDIINKKAIPTASYTYAREESDEWTETDGSSRKYDKLFIRVRWINKNIDTSSEGQIMVEPLIIELEDKEKFRDNDGNVVEIEVRGARRFRECYFKVSDVASGFNITSLRATIIDKRHDGYIIKEHYQYFYPEKNDPIGNGKIKILYLTYRGLMRVLFGSNKSTADKFLDWATNTLFDIQLGTKEQKYALIADITGVSFDAVEQVFNKSARKMPCIYLICLGSVDKLRDSLKVDIKHPDSSLVYKWGMTDDLRRRLKEHRKKYGKIPGSDVRLAIYEDIDPQFISTAETNIKHYFENMDCVLSHATYKELAIIPSNKLNAVKEQYNTVAKLYMGHMTEIKSQLEATKRENEYAKGDFDSKAKLLAKDNELLSKDKELLAKDLEISRDNNERLKKKIAKLRKQLAKKSR